jgi:hypothetical protein
MTKPRATALLLAVPALLVGLACKPSSSDGGKVVANVGGEKITEADFREAVRGLAANEEDAKALLENPAAKDNRAQLANGMAMARAIVAYAKQTGLDQDPAIKRQLEQQQAQVYFQAIGKKRMVEPTDAQLLAYYQERVAAMKAQGMTGAVPPFEQVKSQVAEGWKQQRISTLTQEIQQEVKAKVPVTMADEYRLPGE